MYRQRAGSGISSLNNITPSRPNNSLPSPSRSPASSAQVGRSPARRTSTPSTYKNSSENVAAILGGSGIVGNTSQRPNTRSGNVSLPPSPAKAGQREIEYKCKVLVSGGSRSTIPMSLHIGADGVQGFRPTMEDCHFDVLNHGPAGGDQLSIVGVLDGHCGRNVAELGSRILPETFLSHPQAGKNNALALVEAIVETDKRIFQNIGRADGGSTLICAVVHKHILTVACLGDARAVLYDSGNDVAMSVDHKPGDSEETQRVIRCGGMVQFGRVCGVLAVSRALGDFEFKFNGNSYPNREFMVGNIPDVRQINITDATKFLILACDGLWDVLSNDEACIFVERFLQSHSSDLAAATEQTLNSCALHLANHAVERGSMDNVSVQVMLFHKPSSANNITANVPAAASPGAAGRGLPKVGSGMRSGSIGGSPQARFAGRSRY